MFRRVLYMSLVDISVPYGPGINERVFLRDMHRRFGEGLLAVIPLPSRGMPDDLRDLRVSTIPNRGSVLSLSGWVQARAVGSLVLARAITRFRPDLIVMRFSSLPIPQFLASRKKGIQYVVRAPGEVSFGKFYSRNPVRRISGYINDRLSERLWRGALQVEVVTEAKRRELVSMYPHLEARTDVIDNAVDIQDFVGIDREAERAVMGHAPDEVVVGFVGNYPMRRGGREVVDAVYHLQASHRVRGIVVGDGGEAEACREYAVRRGIGHLVRVCGEIPYEQVPRHMASMDIGLSILRPDERAASEQKVRQYLATGLCVVGTAGSNEFLREEEFARVVDSHAAEEVLPAVEALVGLGRATLSVLGGKARRFAETTLAITVKNDVRLERWGRAWRAAGQGAFGEVMPPAFSCRGEGQGD